MVDVGFHVIQEVPKAKVSIVFVDVKVKVRDEDDPSRNELMLEKAQYFRSTRLDLLVNLHFLLRLEKIDLLELRLIHIVKHVELKDIG